MARARTGTGARCASALAAALLLGVAGCAAPTNAPDPAPSASADRSDRGDDRPVVLTTFTVLADIAQNVAGDRLRVESITKPGAEIHGYEPTPGDLRRAAEADLVIDNGMGLEAWFERFTSGIDAPRVVASEGIDPIPIADDGKGSEYAGAPNPHAWMSPSDAQVYVDNLVEAFGELDPEHADEFAANGAAYQAELREVSGMLEAELGSLPASQRALVTCEGAFSYLARDAGLSERYLWPVNAEQQATPQRVAAVIDFVRENEVPAVFCESTVSDAGMQRVVESSKAEFGGTLYVDSLSEPDGPVPSYLELIRHDAETIVSGLTGGREP